MQLTPAAIREPHLKVHLSGDLISERQRIENALAFISPDLPHLEWAEIGMAIKAALDEEGRDLFYTWSEGGRTYNLAAARDTWRSISATGGITVGTLFGKARASGWQDDLPYIVPSSAEQAERQRKAFDRVKANQAERDRRQAEAATKAAQLWDEAMFEDGSHPYRVAADAPWPDTVRMIHVDDAVRIIRYRPKSHDEPLQGWLLVSQTKVDGILTSLEFIDENGRKSALAGGKKAGGFWDFAPIPQNAATIVIGEGIRTCTAIKMAAKDVHVRAALSSGNLSAVAESTRKQYPNTAIILAADLDRQTREPDPHAVAAAMAVAGRLAVPVIKAEAGKDFHDLYVDQGPESVRSIIMNVANQNAGLPDFYIGVDGIEDISFNKTWLVEGIIENDRAYQWFGKWKSGKTLAVLDVACHAALGLTWAGRQTVRSLVVWVASESLEDVKRRMAAWRLYHDVRGPMSFTIRTRPLHLDKTEFAAQLSAEIGQIRNAHPGLPILVVIDTVARSMSGESPENGEGLMSFANNVLDSVVRQHHCACICVHHSGHGEQERSRGSSAFPAALDGSVRVSIDRSGFGPSFVDVKATEMRSGTGGDSFRFRLDVQAIQGHDNFGNSMEEPVLRYTGEPAPAKVKGKSNNTSKKLSNYTVEALKVLEKLLIKHENNLKASGLDPAAAKVKIKDWKKCCDFPYNNAFIRAKNELLQEDRIVVDEYYAWLPCLTE